VTLDIRLDDRPVPVVVLERHLQPDASAVALRADVLRGLTADPKWLPPKWFYDDAGSELFEQITRLPEYYPTVREREVLTARADEIAALTGADTLVELGSGSSEKTRLLLDALRRAGTLTGYVPFDVSESALLAAAGRIATGYPGVGVHAVLGDFEQHLGVLPRRGRRLVAFLGGTIGNLVPAERARFLRAVAAGLGPGESFLLGTDLVKGTPADRSRLVRAYDDAAGVTARFNLNVLQVVNRELDADFDLAGFEHRALFDEQEQWIEMRLRSVRDQQVTVEALGLQVGFAAGEELRTEISAKFTEQRLAAEYRDAGLRLTSWWTDPAGDYAVSLACRDDA
jgi:L-histidine Nalpha-methyltransferase